MRIVVRTAPFDLGHETEAFARGATDMGAVVTFTGVVRDLPGGGLQAMEIEHYPGMTESALTEMAETAMARFSLGDALVIHRFGRLLPGEMIMMVATAARHRKDAFEAAECLMDYLKSRAPFWKREIPAQVAAWVASKAEHEDAQARRYAARRPFRRPSYHRYQHALLPLRAAVPRPRPRLPPQPPRASCDGLSTPASPGSAW